MKFSSKKLALLALPFALMISAGSAKADETSTITVNGSFQSAACTISAGGMGSAATVSLPAIIGAEVQGATGPYGAPQTLAINLTNCAAATTVDMHAHLTSPAVATQGTAIFPFTSTLEAGTSEFVGYNVEVTPATGLTGGSAATLLNDETPVSMGQTGASGEAALVNIDFTYNIFGSTLPTSDDTYTATFDLITTLS